MAVDKGYMSGSSQLLVLSVLKEKPCYGYELIKTLKNQSNNVFDMQEGTLYPILHKLENEGLVCSSKQEVAGRTRKVYSVTDKGLKVLEKEKEEWKEFSSAVNQVLAFGSM
ncbi:MAG: PadR family transcriptional regulator [Erysipelotrichales bacterium]|nr:PadR family transcriptional regulator [Erysipelotrichales bacterium]